MSNQRRIVREAVLKQPGYNPRHDYARQMAAHYEGRIAAAAGAKDMQGIRQDILDHKKENRRHRRRVGIFANTAAAVVGIASGVGGAFAAVAATASVVSGAALLDFIIIGSITYAVGYIVFESSKALFQMEKDTHDKTAAEDAALTGLEAKLQQKLSPADRPSAESASAAKKPSLLDRLRAVFKKSADKPSAPPVKPANAAAAAQKLSA